MKRQTTTSLENTDSCEGQENKSNDSSSTTKKMKYDGSKSSLYQGHSHSLALQSILLNSESSSDSKNVNHNINNAPSTHMNMDMKPKLPVDSLIDDFFESTWQRHPHVYKKGNNDNETSITDSTTASMTASTTVSSSTSAAKPSGSSACPLQEALSMGWDGIANMLEQSRKHFDTNTNTNSSSSTNSHTKNQQTMNPNILPSSSSFLQPLILQNQTPKQLSEIQQQYSSNPFAAYLDGCSIIQNYANYVSMPLSNLCLDLQRSFPHVYCNTYLTPPNSSTVKAHADDRDVFVIQIKGRKKWKVYRKVPVPYPYSHEQVGKNNIPVPHSVTASSSMSSSTTNTNTNVDDDNKNTNNDSTILIETILEEGDILYMPRGYVHEASTTNCDNNPSFHATIAIMTSDWSYSKTFADMTRNILDNYPEHRMAVHVDIGTRASLHNINDLVKERFDNELETIFRRLKESITMETVACELGKKYKIHNHRSECMRKQLNLYHDNNNNGGTCIVGPNAAKLVTMGTKIRASTQEERDSIRTGDRGLTVHENISDALLSIVAHMKHKLKDTNANTNMNMNAATSEQISESTFIVSELRNLIHKGEEDFDNDLICDFTLCSFVKCCVDLGAMSIVL